MKIIHYTVTYPKSPKLYRVMGKKRVINIYGGGQVGGANQIELVLI